MSGHMRRHPTKQSNAINILLSDHYRYSIPFDRMKDLAYLLENIKYVKKLEPEDEWITIEELVIKDLEDFSKPSIALCGARHKEGLTQIELAKLIGIRQENLSKMENGKRVISLSMAKRLSKVLKVDYRVFL